MSSSRSDGRLSGLTAVVTGGGQGIGYGIASVFARERGRVIIADINPQTGAAAAARLAREHEADVTYVEADVISRESTRALLDAVIAQFGALDILCHNAGIYPSCSIEQMTDAEWDRVLATNVKSAFLLVQASIPSMKERHRGKIIVTSSITGPLTAIPHYSHYAASKAGLLGFVRVAAVELAPYGITVNAVLPGNIQTPGLQLLGDDYMAAQVRRIPLGRLGTPEDIGHAMLFFASRESDYVTGQYLVVDGGQTLPEY
jgi:3-oxoacyl-[acyl-carrier protein] reductase